MFAYKHYFPPGAAIFKASGSRGEQRCEKRRSGSTGQKAEQTVSRDSAVRQRVKEWGGGYRAAEAGRWSKEYRRREDFPNGFNPELTRRVCPGHSRGNPCRGNGRRRRSWWCWWCREE